MCKYPKLMRIVFVKLTNTGLFQSERGERNTSSDKYRIIEKDCDDR
jgi:hypothetical protein